MPAWVRYPKLGEVKSELSDIKDHISEVQGKSTDAPTSLETKCASLEKDLSTAKTNYDQLSRDLKAYKNKVVWMEALSRRANLIIDGLKDDPNETHLHTEARVRQIFSERFGLANANTISIVKAYRLGKFNIKRPRDIIIMFFHFKEREEVWTGRTNFQTVDEGRLSQRNRGCTTSTTSYFQGCQKV